MESRPAHRSLGGTSSAGLRPPGVEGCSPCVLPGSVLLRRHQKGLVSVVGALGSVSDRWTCGDVSSGPVRPSRGPGNAYLATPCPPWTRRQDVRPVGQAPTRTVRPDSVTVRPATVGKESRSVRERPMPDLWPSGSSVNGGTDRDWRTSCSSPT